MSKFLKVVVNIILICAILVAGGLLIPPFAGVTTVVVDDVDMDTNLSKGSVTYALEKDSADLKEGNKILVSEGESQYVYEIASISGDACTLEDKLSTDGGTQEKTLGARTKKVYLTVPFIGYVSMALRSTEGLIIVGLAVVFVIILFILAEIWKKDGDEEEDEEEEDDEDEEDEDEDEEAPLSRRERKKAAKAARKAAKKAGEEVWEEPAAVTEKESPVKAEEKPMREAAAKEEKPDQENMDLFEETRNTLAADIASMMGAEESPSLEEPKQEETREEEPEALKPEVTEEEPEEDPAERILAMPVYTKEELLRKAKAAGEEPEVVEDETSGVTILDYSDIL